MYTPYVRLTSGNPRTILDAQPGKNPYGTLYAPPINQALPSTQPGLGSPAVLKYVYYNPTLLTTAPVVAPAPVYWKDSTFTTVTPVFAEAMGGTVALPTTATIANVFVAGWLLPNTTDIAGLVANPTNTPLAPPSLNGSGVWIQVGGFLSGALIGTAAGLVGNIITMLPAGTPFTAQSAAAIPAVITPILGRQLTVGVAVTGGFTADIIVGDFGDTFWGS